MFHPLSSLATVDRIYAIVVPKIPTRVLSGLLEVMVYKFIVIDDKVTAPSSAQSIEEERWRYYYSVPCALASSFNIGRPLRIPMSAETVFVFLRGLMRFSLDFLVIVSTVISSAGRFLEHCSMLCIS